MFPVNEGPEEQVRFPVTYTVDPRLADSEWANTAITLRSDGTASLTEYPVGSLEPNGRGGICLDWDGGALRTGPATWVLDDNSRVLLESRDRESVLSAGSQGMGETNWAYDLGVAFCDGSDDLLFVTADSIG